MDDDDFDDIFNDLDDLVNDAPVTQGTTQGDALRSSTTIPASQSAAEKLSSPMDWFLRVGDEESEAKRRQQEETEASYQYSMMRISMAKELRKAQAREMPNASMGSAIGSDAAQKKVLKFPPSTGVAWVGLSSPDGTHRGYLSARSTPKTTTKELRVYGSSEFRSLLASVQAERNATSSETDEMHSEAAPANSLNAASNNSRRMKMRFDNEEDGNFADTAEETTIIDEPIEPVESDDVFYRFNAGASQAIRRNIKIEAFIQR